MSLILNGGGGGAAGVATIHVLAPDGAEPGVGFVGACPTDNPVYAPLVKVDPTIELWIGRGLLEVRCVADRVNDVAAAVVGWLPTLYPPPGMVVRYFPRTAPIPKPNVPCVTCGIATASCGDRCRYCAGVLR